ncbi:MAG TPA: hypothetical protein VFO03_03045 [Gaiellaceae bacterium]|nr:hypothetical protein [Gaiellaceae bacterium]
MSRIQTLLFGRPDTIAGTVYGTIVVMSALAAGAPEKTDPGKLAVIVTTTVLVFWIAHVYSHAIAETIALNRRLDRAEITSIVRREFAIPLAAVAPVTALALGALGVFKASTASWVAVLLALSALVVQGFRYAGVEHMSRFATLLSVAVNLALGLSIIILKAAVSH